MGRQIGGMNTIYTTNIVFCSFGDAAGEPFRSISHEADEVDRETGRLSGNGEPLIGGYTIINSGFVISSEVVDKYMPDNVVFTAPGMTRTSYMSYNEGVTNGVYEWILMKWLTDNILKTR